MERNKKGRQPDAASPIQTDREFRQTTGSALATCGVYTDHTFLIVLLIALTFI
jgi:hypothetical protein